MSHTVDCVEYAVLAQIRNSNIQYSFKNQDSTMNIQSKVEKYSTVYHRLVSCHSWTWNSANAPSDDILKWRLTSSVTTRPLVACKFWKDFSTVLLCVFGTELDVSARIGPLHSYTSYFYSEQHCIRSVWTSFVIRYTYIYSSVQYCSLFEVEPRPLLTLDNVDMKLE
jgi:hypothetical protein